MELATVMAAEKEREESLTRSGSRGDVDGDMWAPRVGARQIAGWAKEA